MQYEYEIDESTWKIKSKKDEIITTPIPPNTDIYTNGSLQYISQEEAKQIAFRKF